MVSFSDHNTTISIFDFLMNSFADTSVFCEEQAMLIGMAIAKSHEQKEKAYLASMATSGFLLHSRR